MFRLNKPKSIRSGDRITFNFSNFQAVQVPKGWDRLFVSLVHIQTGKTIAKLGKASVRNGTCRWSESLTESLSVSQEDGDSEEVEECLLKFVVAVGTSRSGILGEANLNVGRYANSKATAPLSLPLSKCDYGTTLQLKLQCLTPRPKFRDEQGTNSNSNVKYATADSDDMEAKSNGSDATFFRGITSSSNHHAESLTEEQSSREPSLSASASWHSSDSTESGKDNSSPQSYSDGISSNQLGRQYSASSENNTPSHISMNSSFNSKATASSSPHVNRREKLGRNSTAAVASSPFNNADSTKDLMEAAQVTIEELRAEVRMWERNAKKSALDMEGLRTDLSEQSQKRETLEMELSTLQRECASLNQEILRLNSLLEESKVKRKASEDMKLQDKNSEQMQKEMEDELRFHQESNADLAEQLQKTQESNVELLSILQELEGIVETQKAEIENLSAEKLKLQERLENSNGNSAQDGHSNNVSTEKPRKTGDELDTEDSNLQIQLHKLLESQVEFERTIEDLEKDLEDKIRELEMEQDLRDQALLDCESKWRSVLAAKDEQVANLEAQLSQLLKHDVSSETDHEHDLDLAQQVEFLKAELEKLEKDCSELLEENLQLVLKLKEAKKNFSPSDDLLDSSAASTSETEVSQLKSQLKDLQLELKTKDSLIEKANSSCSQDLSVQHETKCQELEIQLQAHKDRALHLEDELCKCQAQLEEHLNENQQLTQKTEPSLVSYDVFSQLHEHLLHYLEAVRKHLHLSETLADPRSICFFDDLDSLRVIPATHEEQVEVILKYLDKLGKFFKAFHDELDHNSSSRNKHCVENGDLKRVSDCISHKLQESSDLGIECDDSKLNKELAEKVSEIEALKTDCRMKEEEIGSLREKQTELKDQISNLQEVNAHLKEKSEVEGRERSVTLQQLDELSNELKMLNSSMESQIGANKILERRSLELERGKQDLELHLLELEGENRDLSEQTLALEAQLRYLTDEKESCRLELQHSEEQVADLNDEIRRLENEMESQKFDMKQKLQDLQKRWSEVQEECEYLKKANAKLQITIENLIEECNSVQKSNADLKMQNVELHKHCAILEARVRDADEKFSKCSSKIEALEAELFTMLDEISLKEKTINSELELLANENKEHKEKLIAEENFLNQKYSEKALEAENLQRELVHLIDQISTLYGENEKLTSETILELSSLRSVKVKLEIALSELLKKFVSSEEKLKTLQTESDAKVSELMTAISSSRQKQEALLADYEKLLGSLESTKCSEEKCKSIMHGLEMKLKDSEFERKQLAQEITDLKLRLQKAMLLQDDVLALKNSLTEAKFENERLKTSFNLLSGDHEQVKAQKLSFVQKISRMEKSIKELEECKRRKLVLEEKIFRLEGDLSAKEALCAQDATLKIELGRVKRANNELQIKIRHLEEDKEEFLKKATVPLSSADHERQLPGTSGGSSEDEMADLMSRIQVLEHELTEALEANEMYKDQLKRILSEENTPSGTPKLSANQNGANAKGNESAVFLLEMELRDLRERYFQMSLKYAEVEAEREQLVLKLKSTHTKRRWFS